MIIPVLILFPFLVAIIIALVKDDKARGIVIYCGSVITIAMAFYVLYCWITNGCVTVELYEETHMQDLIILCGELFLMCLVTFLSFKHKKYWIALLSIVQTLSIVWLEEFSGVELLEKAHIRVDYLSVVMMMIVAIIGGLIVIYAVGYMRGYHHHHPEFADRRGFFLPLLFAFLGAMFGIVLSASMTWMYFFWEITSVISFLLIGYTRTPEAIFNSFRALWMNLLGGLCYAIGIIWFALTYQTVALQDVINAGAAGSVVAIGVTAFLAVAALTKSAQLPFSQWLLGAMVAPTPSSALLHSATMVKAGVYLLLRLSPAMHGNLAGTMVALIGGFTFFCASLMAIAQSDGKKVLAFSTISNLGLITACAGIGTAETVWAGVFLIIFHAVSKSMLFQTVGAIENTTGSRDVEDMAGLIIRLPDLAIFMLIGICGMFLAPFGMLVSKWAALKAFVDVRGVLGTLMVLFVCFGSATTLLYWSKWLGKILDLNHRPKEKDVTEMSEYASLRIHGTMMMLLCVLFPAISTFIAQPIVKDMFGEVSETINSGNLTIMVILLLCVFIFPTTLYLISKNIKRHIVLNYMAGINSGDSQHFIDSMGNDKELVVAAWYLEDWFSEKKILAPALICSASAIILLLTVIIGGAL